MTPAPFPHPQPAPLILSNRDEDILRAVSTYRFVTAKDMCALLYSPKSLTFVRERLSALSGHKDHVTDGSYPLYRFALPTATIGNRERIYTLSTTGRQILESLGLPVDWHFQPSKVRNFSHSHILYNIILTRFVVAAHTWSLTQAHTTLVASRLCYELARDPVLLAVHQDGNATTVPVIPDCSFWFRTAGTRSHVLFELDRGMEDASRYLAHVKARLAFIRSGAYERVFQTKAVIIAYATTGRIAAYRETRRRALCALTQEALTELHEESLARIFRFTAVQFETLYEHAPSLFVGPVWYRPDSSTPIPLLTA